MSQQPQPTPPRASASGGLWTLGALVMALGIGLGYDLASALIWLGGWLMITGWKVGAR